MDYKQQGYPDKYYKNYKKAGLSKWDFPKSFWNIFFGLPTNSKILDYGVGSGNLSSFLHDIRPDLFYFGADIANLKSVLPEFIIFQQVKENSLLFKDEKFDFIICNQVLEHIPEPLIVLKTFYDCMNSHAFCFIATPSERSIYMPSNSIYNLYSDYGHLRAFSCYGIKKILDETGLKVLKVGFQRNWKTILIAPYLLLKTFFYLNKEPYYQLLCQVFGARVYCVGQKEEILIK